MSDNLNLSQVASNQNNKETTINDKGGELDAALTEVLSVLVDNTNAVTLTGTQFRRHLFFDIDPDATPPDAAVTVTVPAVKRGLFAVRNNTAQEVTVEVSGQPLTAPSIAAGGASLLSCDGTNVRAEGSGGGGVATLNDVGNVNIASVQEHHQIVWDSGTSQWVNKAIPYDLLMYFPGTHSDGERIAEFVFSRNVDFPSGLTGSQGRAAVAPTGSPSWDLRKNGVSIGSVDFTASSNSVSFTFSSAQSFAAGDRLTIVADNPADTTLADVSLALVGTRKS